MVSEEKSSSYDVLYSWNPLKNTKDFTSPQEQTRALNETEGPLGSTLSNLASERAED